MAAESKHSATATVVVGILTAASGLLGYAIAGWQQSSQQNKTLTSQAREADKQELRGVVDEAGSALLRTSTAIVFKPPAPGSGPRDPYPGPISCSTKSECKRE